MWKKLLKEKNAAIGLGLIPVLFGVLFLTIACVTNAVTNNQYYTWADNLFVLCSTVTLASVPLLFTLLISIPAYFMREEVHSFWFRWMMVRYMPVACILTFLMAAAESGEGSGWGPSAHGIGMILSILIFSALFIVLSVLLIIAKYVSLRREKSNVSR